LSAYTSFVNDYNNPKLTGHDVRRLNNLNHKEYGLLRKQAIQNGDIPAVRHMNQQQAKFYSQKADGTYTVQKQIGDKIIYVGRFPDKQTSKKVVRECIEHNWQVNEVQDFIDTVKVKPKNYSLVNGYYVIQKSINGVNTVFCTLNADKVSEDIVKSIVSDLRDCGWDMLVTDMVLKEYGVI